MIVGEGLRKEAEIKWKMAKLREMKMETELTKPLLWWEAARTAVPTLNQTGKDSFRALKKAAQLPLLKRAQFAK